MEPALIDTDIVSYFLKGNEKVVTKFQEYLKSFDSINLSIITYYEVVSGLTFKNASKQLEVFEEFCSTAKVLNLTKESIRKSAEIYSVQRFKGEPIDDIDILIAGIALSLDLTLVTNNTKHFGRIDELKLENWNE
ncbi:type II toxin-antitoxin system VapC family toxin [Litoribacter ruber]|uniref:type II toxin-antitoxin system VapC family toxin n=1 Tax=Litoribacter ruber TaxID=702568 RepID=UPI001BD963A3|nr:type II toxin-antitoxin system VapC family toxin [Litoribacter ruber]MBT0810137.1 type II toxin-antitoxin system VapC family toxin [Litoribacter ruber]